MAATVIQVFEDTAGQWRWHAVNTGNHTIIATSGESFDSEQDAIRAARGAGIALAFAPVKVLAQPRRTHSYVPPLARVPIAPTPLARGRVPISAVPQVRGRTGPSPLAVALRRLGQQ